MGKNYSRENAQIIINSYREMLESSEQSLHLKNGALFVLYSQRVEVSLKMKLYENMIMP